VFGSEGPFHTPRAKEPRAGSCRSRLEQSDFAVPDSPAARADSRAFLAAWQARQRDLEFNMTTDADDFHALAVAVFNNRPQLEIDAIVADMLARRRAQASPWEVDEHGWPRLRDREAR
jgi:hypothetical protein